MEQKLNPVVSKALERAKLTGDDAFVRLVYGLSQAEAGGRSTDANGNIITGPKTRSGQRASGPLQVMPGTFTEVNNTFFGGKLDPKNNEDLALAGVMYAKQMYDRAGGNLFNAAKMYHGGPGAMGKNPRDTGTGMMNNDYAAKVTKAAGETPKRTAEPKPVGFAQAPAPTAAPVMSDAARVAAAAAEVQYGLPDGAMASLARPDTPPAGDWSTMLQQRLADAAPLVNAINVPAIDPRELGQMAQLQSAASAQQDAVLASMFPTEGDSPTARPADLSGVPPAVDRYLDRILRG